MNNETPMYDARPELERLAEQTFSFLVTDKGWSRGRTEKNAGVSTFYFKPARFVAALAVEVTIDFQGESVDVNLVKMDAGKTPTRGHDETAGGIIRRRIDLLLADALRIRDPRLDEVSALLKTRKPWDCATAESLLRVYGAIVATYIDKLLQQPIDILFPPSRKRSR